MSNKHGHEDTVKRNARDLDGDGDVGLSDRIKGFFGKKQEHPEQQRVKHDSRDTNRDGDVDVKEHAANVKHKVQEKVEQVTGRHDNHHPSRSQHGQSHGSQQHAGNDPRDTNHDGHVSGWEKFKDHAKHAVQGLANGVIHGAEGALSHASHHSSLAAPIAKVASQAVHQSTNRSHS
jgi:hypothetical protein